MQTLLKTRSAAVALAVGSLVATFAAGANASTTTLGTVSTDAIVAPADAFAGQAPTVLARRGADDGAGHQRRGRGRDDGPNHTSLEQDLGLQFARRGADDGAGHQRRGRGRDDGPNHTSLEQDLGLQFARRGRGRDDGPNHA